MHSFIWKVSLYRFLDAFNLVAYIFTIFFSAASLNPFQISLLIVIWSLSQLLFEIPMGIVADKYPRRNVLIASSLVLILGFCCWIVGGFLFFALGMILFGLRNALYSGTQEAFVFDELKSLGKEEQYANVMGKLEGSMQIGFMVSVILGGLVGQFNYSIALIISIIAAVGAISTLMSIKSVQPVKSTKEKEYFNVLAHAIKEIHQNKKILLAIIFISCTFGIAGAADKYFPLVFESMKIPTAVIGLLVALEIGMFALAGYSFQYWNKLKNNYWHLVLILLSGILFIIFGLANSVLFLPFIFLSSYIGKLSLVKLDADMQHQITSDQRATILSIKGLVFEVVFLLATSLFGLIANKYGLITVIIIWGCFYLFWTTLFAKKLLNYK